MSLKPKTVEITLRVRVPRGARLQHVRREIANSYWGTIYVTYPDLLGCDTLHPRWGRARLVASATHLRSQADSHGRALHNRLSEMVEERRLTRSHIPDDYDWLCEALRNGSA